MERTEKDSLVGVLGQGYVGLPLSLSIAKAGYTVVGIDTNKSLVAQIRNSNVQIAGVNNQELLEFQQMKRYAITEEFAVLSKAKIILICVPTPMNKKFAPNLDSLLSAVDQIATWGSSGTLVINESTSFPGTLKKILDSRLHSGSQKRFHLAVAPERINPGDSRNLVDVPRVVGGLTKEARELATSFYESLGIDVFKTSSAEVAEMSKLLENSFRYVNISLVNEIQDLCYSANIDFRESIEAANTKPYGFMPFYPGPGVGGHCIPIDPEYLQYFATLNQKEILSISTAREVNESIGAKIGIRVLDAVAQMSLEAHSGLVVGVTYKPNVPDTRETPSRPILDFFRQKGIEMSWHDPLIPEWNREKSEVLEPKRWDFGLITSAHDCLDIELVIDACKIVFDCTGVFGESRKVIQI